MRWYWIALACLGLLLFGVIPALGLLVFVALLVVPGAAENEMLEFVQPLASIASLTVLGVLAWITWRSTQSTRVIAEQTGAQAKASLSIVEEQRRTRFDSLRPLLVLHSEQYNPSSQVAEMNLADLQIPVRRNPTLRVANVGVGPAVDNRLHVVRLRNVTSNGHEVDATLSPAQRIYALDPLRAGGLLDRLVHELPIDSENYYLLLTYSDVLAATSAPDINWSRSMWRRLPSEQSSNLRMCWDLRCDPTTHNTEDGHATHSLLRGRPDEHAPGEKLAGTVP